MPDLDEHRAEQRGDERERMEMAGAERQRGADEHRRDGRRQRAHARRHHPDAHRAHAVRLAAGNREKSGLRLSL